MPVVLPGWAMGKQLNAPICYCKPDNVRTLGKYLNYFFSVYSAMWAPIGVDAGYKLGQFAEFDDLLSSRKTGSQMGMAMFMTLPA